MGDANLRLGRFADAAKALRKIIKINPENVKARRMLADVHVARQELNEACEQLWVAVKGQPDDASLWVDLGYTMSRMKDHENALRAFQKALELGA